MGSVLLSVTVISDGRPARDILESIIPQTLLSAITFQRAGIHTPTHLHTPTLTHTHTQTYVYIVNNDKFLQQIQGYINLYYKWTIISVIHHYIYRTYYVMLLSLILEEKIKCLSNKIYLYLQSCYKTKTMERLSV